MIARHLEKAAPTARLLIWFAVAFLIGGDAATSADHVAAGSGSPKGSGDRSPIDVVLSKDGRWLITANQTSDSISLISRDSLEVVDELVIGDHPANLVMTADGTRVLVTAKWSGTLHVICIDGRKLVSQAEIFVGMHPVGIAVAPQSDKDESENANSERAYVSLTASAQIAEVDLNSASVTRTFETGNWPRYLTVSGDGNRLSVGCSGDSEVAVIDIASGKTLYTEPLTGGINMGQMVTSPDGNEAYVPWMIYRTNPINVRNIRLGWVLASRIARVRSDGPAYREAISLDVPGLAVADPHDLAITQGGKHLVASSSGTHELLVYRLADLPFVAEGGPGDLIDRALERDRDRFFRIETGGRPMGIAAASDANTLYVANFLRNSIQVVDLDRREVTGEVALGSAPEMTLARRGMEAFYDAELSLDQWYSCHSCHQDGGTNSRLMDTWNDATEGTYKTVLPLENVTRTPPWTWHGWQTDLVDSMHNSVVSTMQGTRPDSDVKDALIAYLDTLELPPNPFRHSDGSLPDAAKRGEALFQSDRAACADCHSGPNFTDGQIHDVGTGSDSDHYQGYNTPSLAGTYRKVRWLHNGRAKSLESVLTEYHRPDDVSGTDPLTDQQVADLIAYLRSL